MGTFNDPWTIVEEQTMKKCPKTLAIGKNMQYNNR